MNSQHQVKSMLKEKASLLQKHGKHLFGKSSGTILPTPSNPRKKSKRYLQNTKSPFHLAPHTERDKVRGKSFSSQKIGSKKFHNGNQKKTTASNTYYRQTGSQQQRHGRYNCSTANVL